MTDQPTRNPRNLPPVTPALQDVGPCSLAERLAKTINHVRQKQVELGVRMYRVFSIRRHWSGGTPGRGDVTDVCTRELTPRPKVDFRNRRELTAAGWIERGVVVISEINPQLTEDEVIDLFSPRDVAAGDEQFIEVVMDARDGQAKRRRLVISEPPRRTAFAWSVTAREQDTARERSGATTYPGKR